MHEPASAKLWSEAASVRLLDLIVTVLGSIRRASPGWSHTETLERTPEHHCGTRRTPTWWPVSILHPA